MTDAVEHILHIIGTPSERGLAVSRVLCALVVEGGALGELHQVEITENDGSLLIKVPPAHWFERLRNAVERGAFERMAEHDIVARILNPLEQAA